jgi:hypothetical protein
MGGAKFVFHNTAAACLLRHVKVKEIPARAARSRPQRRSFGRADESYHDISNTWLAHGFLSPLTQCRLCDSCAGDLPLEGLRDPWFTSTGSVVAVAAGS